MRLTPVIISSLKSLKVLIAQLSLRQATDRLRTLTVYRVVFRAILTIFSSLALTFFIFKVYNVEFSDWQFKWFFEPEKNRIFLFSWLIILLLNLVFLGLFGNLILASGSLGILAIVWLFINQVKIASRHTPFLPEDLFLAGEAGEMTAVIDDNQKWFLITSIVLIGMIIGCSLILKRLISRFPKPSRRVRLVSGLALVIVGCFGLVQVTQAIKNPAKIKDRDNFIGNDLIAWNQYDNFYFNGPVIGFVYNIGKINLPQPTDYSKEKIAQIVKHYQTTADSYNQQHQTKPISQYPINVAMVLSESMVLPTQVADIYPLNHNPMPWLSNYIAKQPQNYLQLATSEYGGGTANVEFEILTGLSSTFNYNATPFTNFLPKIKDFPGFPRRFKQAGAQTIAMHNFRPEMYKRNLAYPNLGFERFDGLVDFQHRLTLENNPYDSDQSFYQQLYDQLATDPDRPKFINGATMQNHTPYKDIYKINHRFAKPDNLSDEQHNILENYYTGLNYTDQALADFYQKLQRLPQKTLVVVYGDHFPGSNALGKTMEADPSRARLTPIVLLANFPLPEHQLPSTISGNYLMSHVSDLFNWQKSGFEMLLRDLRQNLPKLSVHHTQQPTDFRQHQAYADYELIQYDILNGKRFAQKMGFFEVK